MEISKWIESLGKLSTADFWFSVVVMGVLVNLVSSVLWKRIEVLWSRHSARRKDKLDREQSEGAKKAAWLAVNPVDLQLEAIEGLRTWTAGWAIVVLAILGFAHVNYAESKPGREWLGIIELLVVFFFFFLATKLLDHAGDSFRLVELAKRNRAAAQIENELHEA